MAHALSLPSVALSQDHATRPGTSDLAGWNRSPFGHISPNRPEAATIPASGFGASGPAVKSSAGLLPASSERPSGPCCPGRFATGEASCVLSGIRRPGGPASSSLVVDVTPTGGVRHTRIRAVALLAPLAAAALVMLVAALRGLAPPWASAGLTLVGNVLLGFAAACAVRTRTGEPGGDGRAPRPSPSRSAAEARPGGSPVSVTRQWTTR